MDKPQKKPLIPFGKPSKLDDHPLIPLSDFEGKMREVLTVTPEEMQRREAEYQRQQEAKRKGGKRTV